MVNNYELADMKTMCINFASCLGDYKKIDTTDLANGYCEALDNEDETYKNYYMSALVLRFWNRITELHEENPTLKLDYGDYYSWVAQAVMLACDKANRDWQKNIKLNAHQVINQILLTRFKAQAYYDANLAIHKANYNTMSLDTSANEEDTEKNFVDMLEDNDSLTHEEDVNARTMVQNLINQNKVVEAIIVDLICFSDTYTMDKKVSKILDAETGKERKITTYTPTFKRSKLNKLLSSISDSYVEYFADRYVINQVILERVAEAIKTTDTSKLYKSIDATLENLKTNLQFD